MPRAAYLPRTTLGSGYAGLTRLTTSVDGPEGRTPKAEPAYPAEWALRFATSPGAYAGGIALLLSFGGLFSRRWRYLAVGFTVYGFACYLAATQSFSGAIKPLVSSLPLGDVYVHAPHRLSYGLLIALPVLAAAGLEAYRSEGSRRRQLAMVVPGALLWGALPLGLGAFPGHMLLPAAGVAASVTLLFVAARIPATAVLIPALLMAELGVNALVGRVSGRRAFRTGIADEAPVRASPMLP